MDFNAVFAALEKTIDCRLVMHDVRYVFFAPQTVSCKKYYWNIRSRNAEYCEREDRSRCIEHCVRKLRRTLLSDRPAVRYWRCPAGYLQIVAPIFRNDILCGVLYAGIWRRPFDHEKLQRLVTILPLVAEGMFARLEEARQQASTPRQAGIRGRVLELLETHYADPLTLPWLAHQLALSPSRTCHVISEQFHRPFTKVLLHIRLEKACVYLRLANVRVNDAARMCGFISVAYFSNEFRKRFGVSPKAWKNEQRNHPVPADQR